MGGEAAYVCGCEKKTSLLGTAEACMHEHGGNGTNVWGSESVCTVVVESLT